MSVYQDPQSGAWVADVTDLPGCTGVGNSAEEAVATANGFIRDWVEDAMAQGWKIPQPTARAEASGKFLVGLPKSLHARLQELASVEGTDLNQLVVALLAGSVAERGVRLGADSIYPRSGVTTPRVSEPRSRGDRPAHFNCHARSFTSMSIPQWRAAQSMIALGPRASCRYRPRCSFNRSCWRTPSQAACAIELPRHT
jgi:predicted RNase H-like HicB family nuclease